MNRRQRRAVFLLLTGLVLVAVILVLVVRRWGYIFSSPEELRRLVHSWGVWAPLGTILLQLVQIVLAPLPGNLLAFAAGYALGFWPTIVWLMIGVLGGATITFLLSRVLGRRLLRVFVPGPALERFDRQVIERGTFYLFLLLLVPNPIGDWVYYLAGLTRIPLPFFLLLVLLARLPSNIIECGIGASAIRFGLREWLIFGLVVVLLTAGYLLNQHRIEHLLLRLARLRDGN
ncbi:MAG: VTT domain-containing protein [candidate division WOR-3 bacterium]